MAMADEQIRVSDRVKRALDRRRREGESYNDVLERVLDEQTVGGDFEAGSAGGRTRRPNGFGRNGSNPAINGTGRWGVRVEMT